MSLGCEINSSWLRELRSQRTINGLDAKQTFPSPGACLVLITINGLDDKQTFRSPAACLIRTTINGLDVNKHSSSLLPVLS